MPQKQLYNYTKSPLFRLKSKNKLADILQISKNELSRLEKLSKQNIHIYSVFTVGEKRRTIQHPVHPLLVKVQTKLFTLFKRIELPDYVHSGKRNHSYVTNALIHKDAKYFLTIDIEHFYENTKGEFVFQFFFHKMEMASDLAHILTNILTYNDLETSNQKIPTGSKMSQLLAYWAYSDMFNSIAVLATENNYVFSLYVDDMTFSSQTPIPKDFHKKIEELLRAKKLRFKRSKLRYYSSNQSKQITGIIITPDNHATVPNNRLKNTKESINKALAPSATRNEKISALGKISSIQQIKPHLFENVIPQLRK